MEPNQEIKDFSSFSQERLLSGSKVSINEVVNKTIVIFRFQVIKTQYSDQCYMVQFKFDTEEDQDNHVFFTSSRVLSRELIDYKERLPFRGKVIKNKNKQGQDYFEFQ